jgi:hypothetical protein
MPVDKVELAKDLETNPDYQNLAKETLVKKDFIVRTKDEEASYLNLFKTDVIEKEIPGRIKSVHDQYDKDAKELFGIDRDQNEKSYDYLKRAATTKLTGLQTQIKTLEEDIKKGDPSGAIAKKLTEAENQYKAELAKKDAEITDLRTKFATTEKRGSVQSIYSDLKPSFVKNLPGWFARTEKSILDETLANSGPSQTLKDKTGAPVLVMMNADGTTRKDAAFNEITVEAFMRAELKDVIDPKFVQGGAGSKDKGPGAEPIDPATITKDNFILPETVKTKDDLMTHLLSLGLIRGSAVFNEIWKVHAKDKALA